MQRYAIPLMEAFFWLRVQDTIWISSSRCSRLTPLTLKCPRHFRWRLPSCTVKIHQAHFQWSSFKMISVQLWRLVLLEWTTIRTQPINRVWWLETLMRVISTAHRIRERSPERKPHQKPPKQQLRWQFKSSLKRSQRYWTVKHHFLMLGHQNQTTGVRILSEMFQRWKAPWKTINNHLLMVSLQIMWSLT